jgi:glycosyltransferase involved in cell wall biosynthesis
VTLVTARSSAALPNRIGVDLVGPEGWPKSIRFILGVIRARRRIRRELAQRGVKVLEFSRSDYALFAGFFRGRRIFTFHGPGQSASENPGKRLLQSLPCYLFPFIASGLQVVGRTNTAIPRSIRAWFKGRIVNIDAWFDDRFRPGPLPPLSDEAPLVVFYSGRLGPEKNPELLFEIVRLARARLPFPIEFRYFGGDAALVEGAGLAGIVTCEGMLAPDELAAAINRCHAGMLCSKFEGSPFAMIEGLACGRCFVAPPLEGLIATYKDTGGVFFAERQAPEAYLAAFTKARQCLLSGRTAGEIAKGVEGRSQAAMTHAVLRRLRSAADSNTPFGFNAGTRKSSTG